MRNATTAVFTPILGTAIIILVLGSLALQSCESPSPIDFGRPGGRSPGDRTMTFKASDFTYYSQGEEQTLQVFLEKVACRVDTGKRDDLQDWLEPDPAVKKPLDVKDMGKGILIVALEEGLTLQELLALVKRLNGSGIADYAGPMFTSPSVRTILTHEIVVKFKDETTNAQIKAFISGRNLSLLKKDDPMPGCYLLGFTSQSGTNPLKVSREIYESSLVEYAHPNFMDWMEPPDGIHVDDTGPGLFVSEENAMLLYPNLFQEFGTIVSTHPMLPTGWEPITEEDFEGLAVLNGWSYMDDNPESGLYYWGQVSDADYPNLMGDGYQPDGYKGWVARHHTEGDPDRWPDMEDSPEGYAMNMDTWLVYGPMDLSNSLWARFRFRGALFAPSHETFGWYVSIDGENWFGQEEAGVGEQRKLLYWWPKYSSDPEQMGMYVNLSRVPELGDLTGYDEVYVAFRFQSDGSVTPKSDQDDFSFYGVFLDNVIVEHCADSGLPGITSDPLSNRQWGLKNTGQSGGIEGMDINADAAWEFLDQIPGATHPADEENPVIVAVLDEGVDLDHEDLNLVPGHDATYDPEDNPDHEDSQGGPLPWDGHGTACAGIIGAKENGLGVVGVAPGVKIMPVRIAYSPEGVNGWVTTKAQQADGILWAAQNGAKVLSNSWGGGFSSDLVSDAIHQAVEMGSVVLFASGNGNHDFPGYPSNLEDSIAVGAMSPCGERKSPDSCDGEWWWGSNYGSEEGSEGAQIDVVAPGVLNPTTDITGGGGYVPANVATGKEGNYTTTFNGTSSACPHTAGVAALLLCANPDLGPDTVRGILRGTARDIGDPGWDYETGYGLVDANAALRAAAQSSGDLLFTGHGLPEYLYAGRSFQLDVSILNDGAMPAGPFYVQAYLSFDSQVGGNDVYLWHSAISIDAHAVRQVTADVQVPGDVEIGFYNLIVVVDGEEEVFERDEENNFLVHAVQVAHEPNLVLKPSAVDFGEVQVGSGAQATVRIKNEGEQTLAPLVVSAITFGGNAVFDNPDNLVPSTPLELETNESVDMWLYFVPEAAGTFNGILTIQSNDPDQPVVDVPLTGAAVEPQPVLFLDHVPVDFGEASTFEFFYVKNTGDGVLEWSLETTGMPAWITRLEPTSGNTNPGAVSNVVLNASRNLLPAGNYSWDLPVSSNGGNDTVHISMTVSGQTLSVTPDTVEFGEAGTTDTITLENTGGFDLNWTLVDDFPSWLEADDMGGALSAGTSVDVHLSVERAGLTPGTYNHTVQIGSNGGSATVEVSMTVPPDSVPEVTATAVPASGSAPLTVDFGADVTGGDAPLTFAWDFDDGDTSTEQNPTHVYTLPGTYTARVSVTDADADSDWDEVSVTVTGGAWSRTYGHGGTYAEYHTYGLEATGDGGLVFCAESIFGGQGGYDFWVVRLDAAGDVLWEKGLGGGSGDYAKEVRQTSDNGVMVAGESYSYRTGTRYSDAWLIKFTEAGAIDWQRTYGGSGTDIAYDVRETFDGTKASTGFVVTGTTTSFGAGGYDLWVLKLDTLGTIEWQKTFGGGSNEFGRSGTATPDGGYLVVADTQSFGAGSRDIWVVKLTASGTVEWEKTLGGAGSEIPSSVQVAGDGGYAIGAGTGSFGVGGEDFWVVKLDAAGDVSWQYTYGGAADDHLQDMENTADGGFVITGWSDSFGEAFSGTVYNDAWVLKLDGAGAVEWQKIYNYPFEDGGEVINAPDWAYAVTQTTDGGYAVSGDAEWWSSDRNSDSWIFKVDGQGALGCDIENNTGAVRDGGGAMTVGGSNAYSVSDTTATAQTSTATPYESVPDVTAQCGP